MSSEFFFPSENYLVGWAGLSDLKIGPVSALNRNILIGEASPAPACLISEKKIVGFPEKCKAPQKRKSALMLFKVPKSLMRTKWLAVCTAQALYKDKVS